MPGSRRRKNKDGKLRTHYDGWYIDRHGKQKFFKGTPNPKETLAIAQRHEERHRLMRLGHIPVPEPVSKPRTFDMVCEEYLAWGKSQGGRGGRPWGRGHERMRQSFLGFWKDELKLKTMTDLHGILPRVEKSLRELHAKGRTGRTLQNYADGLAAFCDWCKKRGYLNHDPLEALEAFDSTPQATRRALTTDEISKLLAKCDGTRRLLYETAICTGLRAAELASLRVSHLDVEQGGLHLDPAWTKNRKAGFQNVAAWLVAKLASHAKGKAPDSPLLSVPSHPARELDKDLKEAGVAKCIDAGKVDFHAFRVAFVTMVCESGANPKEAQTLARHSTPNLTMNVYA